MTSSNAPSSITNVPLFFFFFCSLKAHLPPGLTQLIHPLPPTQGSAESLAQALGSTREETVFHLCTLDSSWGAWRHECSKAAVDEWGD